MTTNKNEIPVRELQSACAELATFRASPLVGGETGVGIAAGTTPYPELAPWDLEPHYAFHVGAMTEFALHSKHDIAIQLAWRDQRLQAHARDLQQVRAELGGEIDRVRSLINRDRTGLAAGLDDVRRLVRGYEWLGTPDEWGSYDYTQRTVATVREEVRNLIAGVLQIVESAMRESGRRADSAFRPPPVKRSEHTGGEP